MSQQEQQPLDAADAAFRHQCIASGGLTRASTTRIRCSEFQIVLCFLHASLTVMPFGVQLSSLFCSLWLNLIHWNLANAFLTVLIFVLEPHHQILLQCADATSHVKSGLRGASSE